MNLNLKKSILYAILAAVLYAISTPFSKILMNKIPATLMAALLYLGAGIGILILEMLRRRIHKENIEDKMSKCELPYILGMVVLDILAPIFLMFGLTMTSASNASLLNNFEIVATSVIALFIFKEVISKKLWLAIGLITISSIILSFEDVSSLSFSWGSILVLFACMSWGFENNCTRKLSCKNPLEVVIIKGFGSGLGSLLVSLLLKNYSTNISYIIAALLLGFVSYGLSISFYVYAQRGLGAAKTSAYYAIAPFVGTGLSLLIWREIPTLSFIVAFIIMIIGTYFVSSDTLHSRD